MFERELRERLGARADYPLWVPPDLAPKIHAALLRLEAPARPSSNVDLDTIIRRVMANTKAARAYLARN